MLFNCCNHNLTFRPGRLVYHAIFVTLVSVSMIASVSAQAFSEPLASGRERPQPVSLEESESRSQSNEHSILVGSAADQNPGLGKQVITETQTKAQSSAPVVASSGVVDDPFAENHSNRIQRAPGSGEEAVGTFATSQNMPTIQSQGGFRAESQTPSFGGTSMPPITSNGLRSSSTLRPQSTGMTLGDGGQANNRASRTTRPANWDQQPSPPQPSNNVPQRNFGASNRPMATPAQTVPAINTPPLAGNRFQGPMAKAPPIHNAPAATQRSTQLATPAAGQSIYDRNVTPTQFQRSSQATPPASSSLADLSVARQIMERYQIDRAPDPLPGKPTRLVELLQRTPQHLRKQMIRQYWETYFDWATVLNSMQYLDWMRQLPPPANPAEATLLNAARAAAKNQLLADEIQLGKSQLKLQQISGTVSNQLMPLPSDQPLVQEYDTHYEWYASRNRLPQSMRGINVMLPKAVQLISDRANTVGTSRNALSQLKMDFARNPSAIGSVLQAARLWNNAEQNLVSSVINYNKAIADYSLTIAPGHSAQQVAGMLISKPRQRSQSAAVNGQTAGASIQQTQQPYRRPAQQAMRGFQQPAATNPGLQNATRNGRVFQAASQQSGVGAGVGRPLGGQGLPNRSASNGNALQRNSIQGSQQSQFSKFGQPASSRATSGSGAVRPLGSRTDLSPGGFEPSNSKQPPANRTFKSGSPAPFQPKTLPPVQQAQPGDRSAMRSQSGFQPPVSNSTSRSNSLPFGR